MQRTKLDAPVARDHFETVVYAGHEAPAKPDPEPVHRALQAIGTPPERG